ncbi:hypothetical protein QYF61_024644, partial [Mycteria americana]
MSSQFLQENAVGNHVKGFTEVQVDNIHSLSLIHWAGHLIIEGDQNPKILPGLKATHQGYEVDISKCPERVP